MTISQIPANEKEPPVHLLPRLTTVTSVLVGLATVKREHPLLQRMAEVRPSDSGRHWASRALPSFFVGEPLYGETKDTTLSVTQTALSFGLVEQRYGTLTTARVSLLSHAAACLASRLSAEVGLVPETEMDHPDTGPSGATVGLGAYYATRRASEANTPREKLKWVGANAFTSLGAVALALPESVSAAAAHAAGAITGTVLAMQDNRAALAQTIY